MVTDHDNKPTARLVDTDDSHAPYIALSYVWGDDLPSFSLQSSNLGQCKKDIDISTLPRPISDAIRFTRNMGVRYLWVDALCIVQDNPIEVSEELDRFVEYYSNSSMVICELQPSPCFSRLKWQPNQRLDIPPYRILRSGALGDALVETSWKRALVLQEGCFSLRRIPRSAHTCKAAADSTPVVDKKQPESHGEVKSNTPDKAESKPPDEVNPKPHDEIKPKPPSRAKPKPPDEAKPQPPNKVKSEPPDKVKSKPSGRVKPKPSSEVKSMPASDSKLEPFATMKQNPLDEANLKVDGPSEEQMRFEDVLVTYTTIAILTTAGFVRRISSTLTEILQHLVRRGRENPWKVCSALCIWFATVSFYLGTCMAR